MHDLKLIQVILKNTPIYAFFVFFKFNFCKNCTSPTLNTTNFPCCIYFPVLPSVAPRNFTNHLEPIISSKDTFLFLLTHFSIQFGTVNHRSIVLYFAMLPNIVFPITAAQKIYVCAR